MTWIHDMARTRRWLALALMIAAVTVGAAAAHATRADRSGTAAASTQVITMRGSVTGLYPGAGRAMRVTVRNPYRHRIVVGPPVARVVSAPAGCPASSLVTSRSSRRVRIAPRGRGVLSVRVMMRPTAPDACQGVTYLLRLRAKATR